MNRYLRGRWPAIMLAAVLLASIPALATANHAWGSYHWARTTTSFTLSLGDNVSSGWDTYLGLASGDWSSSSVLDTVVVPGGAKPRNCRPTAGRVEVCNATYGNTGWLGVAQIWISGTHITQGTVKLNDTYFNTASYNTPEWRRMVACQEVGHTFGLAHQDENFGNPNLGSCMDYTSDPDGPPSNLSPNAHDYEQLELIYAHLDATTTVGAMTKSGAPLNGADWGREASASHGSSTFVRTDGRGNALVTYVIWIR